MRSMGGLLLFAAAKWKPAEQEFLWAASLLGPGCRVEPLPSTSTGRW